MKHYISCGLIYRYGRGYDFNGGRYDALQLALSRHGWRYDIGQDAWIKD